MDSFGPAWFRGNAIRIMESEVVQMDALNDRSLINNGFYDELGDRWYTAFDDPVALLRAETVAKLEWARPILCGPKVLDVGCGAGFASNALARDGFEVTGLDFSEPTLAIAKAHDLTGSVRYVAGDAYELPFANESFDSVIAFDFLEHVSSPAKVVAEISRVLSPQGRFLFHTFNRNWLSRMIVIKGVEWFVLNTPKNMHVFKLFIKPSELERILRESGMEVGEWSGIRPAFDQAFWQLLRTKIVPKSFKFKATSSLALSYCGYAFLR
jgi:2-polyprenyl-6-hydroxyphenyl methylase/3-demethylubiquinone-9 3-methyltransferase